MSGGREAEAAREGGAGGEVRGEEGTKAQDKLAEKRKAGDREEGSEGGGTNGKEGKEGREGREGRRQ